MMPTPGVGLEADLLTIKPQAAKRQGGTEAGKSFSSELQERMDSRESALEEESTVEEEAAVAESEERDDVDDELQFEEEGRGEREASEDEERQETVAAEEAEDEGGKVLPFSLAALVPTEAQPVAGEGEGEAADELTVTPGTPQRALAERLAIPRQVLTPRSGESVAAEPATESAEGMPEGEGPALTRGTKPGAAFQATLEAIASKGEGQGAGDAKAEIAALRQLAVRPPEAASPGRELLSPNASPVMGAASAPSSAAAAQGSAVNTPSNLIQLPVQAPVQQPGWDRAMGERMVWMARNNLQEAQLQLNPRHLGPIEVRLSLNQDQAQVSFIAGNPQAREALESSLPRLREMFADQGLNLGQADVHSRGQERRDEGRGSSGTRAFSLGEMGTEEGEVTALQHAPLAPGRLDFYA